MDLDSANLSGIDVPGDKFLELATTPDRHVLDVLFGDAREAVTVQDRSGRLIYANDRAADIVGYSSGKEMTEAPPSEMLRRFEMIDESGSPFDPANLPGRRVLAGLEAPEVTIGYRTGGSRNVQWSRVNASPVKNDAGEVVWAINYFLDITAQIRARQRERILSRVSEALSTTLRTQPKLKALADVIVPEIASWCGFHLLDEFGYLTTDAVAFPATPDAKALFQIADPGPIALDSDRIQARVLASGETEYIPHITDEMLDAAVESVGAEVIDLLRKLDLGSIICLPLGVRGVWLGTVTLMRDKAEEPFDDADLALIDEIVQRASIALANATLFEREHQAAQALRRGLTPDSIPGTPGVEVAARDVPLSRSGHVGGDFYDVHVTPDSRIALVIGDIEGKGIEAAAGVGVVRQTLKATVALEPDPRVVVRQVNSELIAAPSSRACTLAYILLESDEARLAGTVTLVGHPPPMIIRADGSIEQVGAPCPPAGLLPELEPVPTPIELGPHDILLAYTDGLANRELSPPDAVIEYLSSWRGGTLDDLLDEVLDRFRDQVDQPFDDVALLAARMSGEGIAVSD